MSAAELEAAWRAEAPPIMAVVPKSALPEGGFGKWRIEKWSISEAEDARLMGKALRRDPPNPEPWTPAGEYTRLVSVSPALFDEYVGEIMFDTLDELRQLVPFVERASGSVLITGLGLGVALAAVLRRPEVTAVTVVELEPEVIALTGQHFREDPRLTIVNADAWQWSPPEGAHYDIAWHDFWPNPPARGVIEELIARLSPFVTAQGVYGPDPTTGANYGMVT